MTDTARPEALGSAQRYVEGMERLVDTVPRLASARTVDEVVSVVRTAARELTGADGATFVLRDADKCFYVDEDAIGPLWKGQRFAMESCISGWAMQHREVVTVDDIENDPRIPLDVYRPTFVKSLAIVPIRTDDPIGAIGNYWARPYSPTPTELRLLQALADTTAVALENARTLEELEQIVARRTTELRAAYEDLQHFAAGVAHDLRQPLQSAGGFLELVSKRYGSIFDSDAHVWIEAAQRGFRDVDRLVDDLLAYSRAGAATLEPELVDTASVVARLVERLTSRSDTAAVPIEVGPLPVVETDESLLTVILQNLILNAVAYGGAPDAPVVVQGSEHETGWELVVRDHGPGIPEAERTRIFEAFRRGSTSEGRPGSGMGLAIVARAVARLGGQVDVSGGPAGGACFRVTLPRPPA